MSATAGIAGPHTPNLSPEAALVLALAGTSLPFCESPEAEVERWLRILRLNGRAGRVLQAIGVGEESLTTPASRAARRSQSHPGGHVIDLVSAAATDLSLARDAVAVETADLLAALLKVYGRFFEEALEARGTSAEEVLERLALVSAR